jgi:NADPH:quinone reductase-like Zn-dependent oxidoreductase
MKAMVYHEYDSPDVLELRSQWISKTRSQKMAPIPPKPPSRKDLMMVREFLESGAVIPVIDRCYPLKELPQALRYLATGHARGKIIISV